MNISKDLKAILVLTLSTLLLFCFIIIKREPQNYVYPSISSEVYFDIMLASYVPDDYTVNYISTSPAVAVVEYTSERGLAYFSQLNAVTFSLSLDNENHTITEYHSDRFDGYLLIDTENKNSRLISVWDEHNSFEITGNLEEYEIYKMIESIEVYATPSE